MSRETEEELGIPSSSVDVWCEMPALASSKDGEYTATPVVGEVTNYTSLSLSLSTEEVSSVFTVPLATLIDPANHGYTQFRQDWSTLEVRDSQFPTRGFSGLSRCLYGRRDTGIYKRHSERQ